MKHTSSNFPANGLALLLLMLLFITFVGCKSDQKSESALQEGIEDTVTVSIPEPKLLYGITIDSLHIFEDKIKRNQNLADILLQHNVEFQKINEIATKSKKVFDVRKLNYGKKYTILAEKEDSLTTATHFIYEPNPYEYVVYQLKDSVHAYKENKEIVVEEKELAAEINSSMYMAILEAGGNAELVNKLVDVFAWQIDFFRIQKGDRFKVIYEEESVDGKVVGIGKIKGSYFEHFGNGYYAVHYDQGSGTDYFDEEGNSLRKAFLRAPLEYTRISSRYSGRRYHPVLKRFKAHLGTDYAAPKGTPIRSVGEGIVTEARFKKYNGNYVKIRHNATYSTQYLHMSKIASGIKPGVKVKQGQTIGYVGKTGLATGNHLCFRFWKSGKQVDALKVELPPSEPIKEEHKEAYFEQRKKIVDQLDLIEFPSATVLASVKSPILKVK
ncbi:MAG: peptidoglycan DD-metalloendopeptidase family protein [Bacteroidota bacterium]